MKNGIGKRILMIVALFYIFVTLLAVGILNLTRVTKKEQAVIEEAIDKQKENRVAAMSKLQDKEDQETVSSGVTGESEEASEEASTETAAEAPEEEEIPEDTGTKYYAFTANNSAGRLNIRKEPSIRAKIIGRMHPGDRGYILDIGDEWSRVSVNDKNGYCANEYLSIREIKEEEYPDELKSLIGAGEDIPEEEAGREDTPEEEPLEEPAEVGVPEVSVPEVSVPEESVAE
ncbi:MAG: SH3 domain-containing protein [Lachnospiraceae bacterium]|nr:SH3 domain-containing protein [Lachnospiraceae bacterium]